MILRQIVENIAKNLKFFCQKEKNFILEIGKYNSLRIYNILIQDKYKKPICELRDHGIEDWKKVYNNIMNKK